jgi:hypothetical protein
MRLVTAAIVAMLGLAVSAGPGEAALLITIDKGKQRMIVSRDDVPLYDWPVSTGQRGYDTPGGVYKPFRMEKDHFSREWDDAPMPYSIFFTMDGHAIHGSYEVKKLGRPASHGCVRLSPQNAAILWRLVREEKMANTRVVLTGTIPGGPGEAVARRGVDPYSDDGYATYEPLPSHWRNRDQRNGFNGWSYYPYEPGPRTNGFGTVFRERRY